MVSSEFGKARLSIGRAILIRVGEHFLKRRFDLCARELVAGDRPKFRERQRRIKPNVWSLVPRRSCEQINRTRRDGAIKLLRGDIANRTDDSNAEKV